MVLRILHQSIRLSLSFWHLGIIENSTFLFFFFFLEFGVYLAWSIGLGAHLIKRILFHQVLGDFWEDDWRCSRMREENV